MDSAMRRGLGRLGKYGSMSGFGTMGIECKPGYYPEPIFKKFCVPTSGELAKQAEETFARSIGVGIATSPTTQAAVTGAAGQALGDKIIAFYKNQPVIAIGSTVAVGGFLVYGLMSFLRGR